jgi:hypothetical protein
MVAGAAGQVGFRALTRLTQVQAPEMTIAVAEPDSVTTLHLRMVVRRVQELQWPLQTVQCMVVGQLGLVGLPVPRVVAWL